MRSDNGDKYTGSIFASQDRKDWLRQRRPRDVDNDSLLESTEEQESSAGHGERGESSPVAPLARSKRAVKMKPEHVEIEASTQRQLIVR